RDHQAKVRVDEPLLRLLVAALDPFRQLHFLCPCEQPVATDLLQVERERIGGSCVGLSRVFPVAAARSGCARHDFGGCPFVVGHGATVRAVAGRSPDDFVLECDKRTSSFPHPTRGLAACDMYGPACEFEPAWKEMEWLHGQHRPRLSRVASRASTAATPIR